MGCLLVRDLMTQRVLSLSPQDPLAAAQDLMAEESIRHIPIVDEDRELLGLLSLRDLSAAMRSRDSDLPLTVQQDLLHNIKVGDIMTEEVATTEPEQDIREAAQVMFENKFGCLPVLDGNRLVGILTEADFVRFLARGH